MLRITPKQFAALGAANEKSFVPRLVALLLETFPDPEAPPPDALIPEVAEEVGKARGYGLENEDEIATYVLTAWLLGRDFDEFFPAAGLVLNSPDYSPANKRDWLQQWTVAMFDELEGGED